MEPRLARHGPHETLHLEFIVVAMHAGANERLQSARGQVERMHAWRFPVFAKRRPEPPDGVAPHIQEAHASGPTQVLAARGR